MRLKSLFKLTKGHLFAYLVLIVLVLIHRFTYSFIPLFTQYIIYALNNFLGTPSDTQINLPNFLIQFFESGETILMVVFYVALALFTYQFIRYTLMYYENYLKGAIQEKIAKELRLKIFDHVQNLDYKFHNNSDSGDLIQRATSDVETTSGFIVTTLMQLIGLLGSLFSGVYQMYHINQTIMWISLAVIPVYTISSIIYFNKIEKVFNEVEEKESAMMTVIQENVSASKVVKAFANEPFEIEKMEAKNKAYTDMNIKANKMVALYWGFMDLISLSQYAGITILCIEFARQGVMDAPQIVAALMLLGLLVWPIRGLGRLINEFSKASVAMGRIDEIIKKPIEYAIDGTLEPEIQGHIEFKNVSFKFDDDESYLLKNISFEIKPGETVAIIGKTGSGKTTIINLLMRMYEYEGSILIDGVELRDIKKQHIRKNIGAVLQDPFLYSKTVYENIAIANPKATELEIEIAARTAAIEKDIHTFQNGYQTKVGEKGTTLSGGQKQRIAIARILVSEKPILIFDDALSALDNHTDSAIRKALKERDHKSTNIIITHRITTAKEADKIVVIKDGMIEAIGKHDELSAKEGLYKTLWGIQGKLEKEFLELVREGK